VHLGDKHYVATFVSDEQFQALKKLERLKRPDRQSCTAAVLRDCIEYAYWKLTKHYAGMPVTPPRPLPAKPNETEPSKI